VLVATDGRAKVVDFGIAKNTTAGRDTTVASKATELTLQGAFLGTPSYMSPEQVRGSEVDQRADIWAFGCLLYEMLARRAPFTRETVADTLAAILEQEPDWSLLGPAVPESMRSVLRRCLRKDPERRFHHVADVRIELEEALDPATACSASESTVANSVSKPANRTVAWILGVAASLAVGLGLAAWLLPGGPVDERSLRISVNVANLGSLPLGYGPSIALSPDGQQLAYVSETAGTRSLYMRRLDSLESTVIAGTEGAQSPFFAPDGEALGFFKGNRLLRVDLQGGAPIELAVLPVGTSTASAGPVGTWTTDNFIVIAPAHDGPLLRLPATGGTPVAATTLDETSADFLHRWPQGLPNGSLLYTAVPMAGGFDAASIVWQSGDAASRVVVVENASFGRYLPSGHLVFLREGKLWGAKFDPNRPDSIEAPVLLPDPVLADPAKGTVHMTFANDGSLLYLRGGLRSDLASLVWIDRNGADVGAVDVPPGDYYAPRLSPDGSRLALHIGGGPYYGYAVEADVFVYDLVRGVMRRITHDPAPDYMPIWSPDGRSIVFTSLRDRGLAVLFRIAADGSGTAEQMLATGDRAYPNSFAPDGRTLSFIRGQSEGYALWTANIAGDGSASAPARIDLGPSAGWRSEFSPDGRWLAYSASLGTESHVWVRPFPAEPGRGGPVQVSTGEVAGVAGNAVVRWSRETNELFYRDGNQIMVVSYDASTGVFVPGPPEMLFEADFANRAWPDWDVTADGSRFVMFRAESDDGGAEIVRASDMVLVLDWFTELEQLFADR